MRDAQIQEKQQNVSQWVEEEKRLDAMMEVERLRALETQEEIEDLRRQQRIQLGCLYAWFSMWLYTLQSMSMSELCV